MAMANNLLRRAISFSFDADQSRSGQPVENILDI